MLIQSKPWTLLPLLVDASIKAEPQKLEKLHFPPHIKLITFSSFNYLPAHPFIITSAFLVHPLTHCSKMTTEMEYRFLGNSGLKVSAISLGGW